MSKVFIKLVAGATYASQEFGDVGVVTRGQTVGVAAEKAHFFLDDGYHDALNNFHPYFTQVDGFATEATADGDAPAAKRARKA